MPGHDSAVRVRDHRGQVEGDWAETGVIRQAQPPSDFEPRRDVVRVVAESPQDAGHVFAHLLPPRDCPTDVSPDRTPSTSALDGWARTPLLPAMTRPSISPQIVAKTIRPRVRRSVLIM